jgi:hypothetical protein
MGMPPKLLSKSKYMNGLQCLKLLWLVFNDPAKVPEPDASTQHIFDQGHLVGELAKKLYPEGINVPYTNFRENLNRTRELLSANRPLFEAGFMAEKLFCRVDILNPAEGGLWDIVEVKSSTSVKEENLQDVAFQKFCLEKQGLIIHKCYLAFINNQYVRQGEIDPTQFFTLQDITEEAAAAGRGIDDRIAAMFETMAARVCPDIPVGSYCSEPYDCPVVYCRESLPPHNIFDLYRGGKKCFDLFNSGVLNIKDIPPDFKLNRAQEIQRWCDVFGTPHIEKEPIRKFLDTLKPPLHYLDFETISPAVPLFDGTRPYQRVPFQFSLHISQGRDKLRHDGFLAEGREEPRPAFLRRLKETLGPTGSIVTYNQAFEEGVLKELAEAFPEYGEWIAGVRERLVDLLKPFQSFHYYDPKQKGSASIKSVLPALTGRGYEEMGIAGGEEASLSFLNVTYGEASEDERRQVRADLEKYCGLDTEGMVWIMERLRKTERAK